MWSQGIQCQICHLMFSHQSAISAHYDTAHAQSSGRGRPEQPDAKHECEHCGRKFTQKHHLRTHMSTVHGVGDVKTFECGVCSKTFNVKSNLTAHLRRIHSCKTLEQVRPGAVVHTVASVNFHASCAPFYHLLIV